MPPRRTPGGHYEGGALSELRRGRSGSEHSHVVDNRPLKIRGVVGKCEGLDARVAQASERSPSQVARTEQDEIRAGAACQPVEERPFLARYGIRHVGAEFNLEPLRSDSSLGRR